ncbi:MULTISPECIES: deoxynucleoside kinase [Sphingobacterium]|jgi:deoxyadenosine/deoxycytidine kinase|uniref:Deoxyadenosine/deoxycytidine kinase n=2 Tax=Sphingobacterium TaxID=28453 RepID=A0A2X2IVS9_SPHMU|nr:MULTISPECIES: deoxynucleoside kinase [Sphingobacterium]HAE67543.1 deoxynucleoside kinase [Sphingobacterium sp.]KKO88940.1 deoxynucleoside kinase [Sphingobacterium sp. Ag1]MDF2851506.1 deoxynucleoside kinase [Sphingobacterium multivorum]OFV11064.1 deoxynucleoside kinase [Sphingobacterium sp. HMSC13C05]OJZ07465.1 MAG: deoxynucleoside kinase [Sphingobacterium sp. 40-24]
MHIAIVGNIGAGKTTLTEMLASHFKFEPQFEAVDNNPYLEDFYSDMKRWAFNLQIFFLNSRFRHIVKLQETGIDMIQDRTIYEDAYIFAENLYDMGLMSARDFENYSNIFQSIIHYIKPPDLLIYLKASVPTLVNNIQKRGRDYESAIRLDYLSKLNDKYDKWINNYKDGKVMILDKDNLDFTTNPEDLGNIIQKIEAELFGLFE